MSASAVLTPLPVLIPAAGRGGHAVRGPQAAAAAHRRAWRRCRRSSSCARCWCYLADRDGTIAVQVGGWGQSTPGASGATGEGLGMGPLGITLVVDRLSALMLLVSSIVLLAVVFYAIGQGIRDGDERQPVSIFLPTYLVLSAGVCTAFLAGDLFNLFVGFEVLLSASFVLLTIGASADRVRAGIAYVMVSMVSSLIFLIGLAMIYAATGTLNMAELSVRLGDVPSGTRGAMFAVLMVAFGIKAAVFPLSTWLPDSYPTAPAPVTAVFAGLLTKVGVYAIIRAHSLLFPGGALDGVLLVAALVTMLVGIFGAIAQSDIKRLLSFTLVSHIGYMVFGIALGSQLGMSGAIYYVAHHIVVQTTLFLVVGLIERQAGASTLQRLGGLAAASPLLALVFIIPPSISVAFRRSRASSARSRCWRPVRRTASRAGVGPGGGQRRDEPADAVRDGPGVDEGVLADAGRRPRGRPRRRRAVGPDRRFGGGHRLRRSRRRRPDAGGDARCRRRRSSQSAWRSPSSPGRSSASASARPPRYSTAGSTSRRCWPESHRTRNDLLLLPRAGCCAG